jgi:hypothetical protein
MNASTLYVSFWHICLPNLPLGRFIRHRLSAGEAREMIADARATRSLVCATAHDLLAPNGYAHRQRYEELCGVLRHQYGFAIGIDDFLGCPDAEDPDLAIPLPLNAIEIGFLGCLLVVDCLYQMTGRPQSSDDVPLEFEIANNSVSFSLIEMLPAENEQDLPNGR